MNTKYKLEQLEAKHQTTQMELRSYAKWDEIAHSQYTEELINSGFTAQELKDVSKEKDDLKAVIEYLYENKKVSSIGLWGRSMGAATSVFYESENPGTVNCMVLDSGFANLGKVVDSMAGQFGIPPEFV